MAVFLLRKTNSASHFTQGEQGSCVMSGSKVPWPPEVPTPPPTPVPPPAGALSVLFLMVDDLRPELHDAYKQDFLVTPNLDNFAKSALTWRRAYVQYSHCSPSRNSFMSGRSPQSTGVYNFIDSFRDAGVGDNWTAMPEFYKKHGYYVAGGKSMLL